QREKMGERAKEVDGEILCSKDIAGAPGGTIQC
ncbi:unnamed protein product, partial [marine sediment metagenome]